MTPDDPADAPPTAGVRGVVRAWVAVAMIPVAFGVAMVLGEGLIAAAGYPSGGDEVAPLGIALLISLPVTLLAMIPGALAVLYGRRARRDGSRSALLATIVGWVALAYWVVTFALGLVGRAVA